MSYCTVLNTRIYFEVEGVGDPMILVHGAGQDTLSWRYSIPYLAKHYKTIAIDLPGHGKSDISPGGFIRRTEDYAEYINAFIDEMELNSVILVGHSMSGGNALQASLNRPDQIKVVVPLDGAGTTLKEAVSYSDELMELITVNLHDYWETNFQALCSPKTSEIQKRSIAMDTKRIPAESIIGDLLAYTSFDMGKRIKDISVPVVLITGRDDWSCTPENVLNTANALTCKKIIEVLNGVGHFPHMEEPGFFADTLIRLLPQILE